MIEIYRLHLKIMTALHREDKYLHAEISELKELLQKWDKKTFKRKEMGEAEKEIVGRKFNSRERAVEILKLKSPLVMKSLFTQAQWELFNK